MININHITDITWEFDSLSSKNKVTVYFDNKDTISGYFDNYEFEEFMNDIKKLEI